METTLRDQINGTHNLKIVVSFQRYFKFSHLFRTREEDVGAGIAATAGEEDRNGDQQTGGVAVRNTQLVRH